jgi:hypothetical protein
MLAGTALLTEGTASEPAGILAGARRVEVAPAPEPEPERPEPPAAAEDGEPAAPALVVTRREPVSW